MNHPEIFAVPVLMLADYTLTIFGAKESAAVYRKHFVLASYELNPRWRKSVDQIRWFNPRHFSLVCLVTAFMVFVDQFLLPEWLSELGLGMLFGAWGMLCGRHLTNLLVFRFLKHNPGQISGEVHLSMQFTLKMSQYTYVGVTPLFAAIAILAPNQYTIGIALGILVLAGVHFSWARNTPVAVNQPNAETGKTA